MGRRPRKAERPTERTTETRGLHSRGLHCRMRLYSEDDGRKERVRRPGRNLLVVARLLQRIFKKIAAEPSLRRNGIQGLMLGCRPLAVKNQAGDGSTFELDFRPLGTGPPHPFLDLRISF